MYPDARSFRCQRGAGLPVAIFLITVLALIAVAMTQLQQSTGASMGQQILSQRAFYAAESGAQVAVTEVLGGGSCSAMTSNLNFSDGALKGCEAALTCQSVDGDIDGSPAEETVYTIASEGKCGSGDETSRRTIEVRVR
ncbi:hypothetical protein ACMDCT_14005 [Halomonadaceae bacterium KBTZ08]